MNDQEWPRSVDKKRADSEGQVRRAEKEGHTRPLSARDLNLMLFHYTSTETSVNRNFQKYFPRELSTFLIS